MKLLPSHQVVQGHWLAEAPLHCDQRAALPARKHGIRCWAARQAAYPGTGSPAKQWSLKLKGAAGWERVRAGEVAQRYCGLRRCSAASCHGAATHSRAAVDRQASSVSVSYVLVRQPWVCSQQHRAAGCCCNVVWAGPPTAGGLCRHRCCCWHPSRAPTFSIRHVCQQPIET